MLLCHAQAFLLSSTPPNLQEDPTLKTPGVLISKAVLKDYKSKKKTKKGTWLQNVTAWDQQKLTPYGMPPRSHINLYTDKYLRISYKNH